MRDRERERHMLITYDIWVIGGWLVAECWAQAPVLRIASAGTMSHPAQSCSCCSAMIPEYTCLHHSLHCTAAAVATPACTIRVLVLRAA